MERRRVLYVGGGDLKVVLVPRGPTGAVLGPQQRRRQPEYLPLGLTGRVRQTAFSTASVSHPLATARLYRVNSFSSTGLPVRCRTHSTSSPTGCTGGGVWGSPSVDAAAGTIYFDTGTSWRDCPGTLGGPSLIELRGSDRSVVGTLYGARGTAARGPQTSGSTPTLFTGARSAGSLCLLSV